MIISLLSTPDMYVHWYVFVHSDESSLTENRNTPKQIQILQYMVNGSVDHTLVRNCGTH